MVEKVFQRLIYLIFSPHLYLLLIQKQYVSCLTTVQCTLCFVTKSIQVTLYDTGK